MYCQYWCANSDIYVVIGLKTLGSNDKFSSICGKWNLLFAVLSCNYSEVKQEE